MARVVAVEVPHHVTQRYTELNPVRAGMVDRAERRQGPVRLPTAVCPRRMDG
jgi:hypothetical protein